MKECNCEYEDVEGGDVFEDLTPLSGSDKYYVVCKTNGERKLHGLKHGNRYSSTLFGDAGRDNFKKVNLCYKKE
jgi:hypothetical protein